MNPFMVPNVTTAALLSLRRAQQLAAKASIASSPSPLPPRKSTQCRTIQSRTFTTSPASRGVMPNTEQANDARAIQRDHSKLGDQQGQKSRMSEMDWVNFPMDVGLLPGTFVRPVPENMPKWSQNWRQRLRFEWVGLKTKTINYMSVAIWAKYLSKPSVPFEFWRRKQIAKEYHLEMYSAYGRGDLNTLDAICCSGLLQSFTEELGQRRGARFQWKLHSYHKTSLLNLLPLQNAAVVSDRAITIPHDSVSIGIRQIVVRIRSTQSLDRVQRSFRVDPETKKRLATKMTKPGEQRLVTEYIVLQKAIIGSRSRPWQVWGTTEETTLADLDGEGFKSGDNIFDRIMDKFR